MKIKKLLVGFIILSIMLIAVAFLLIANQGFSLIEEPSENFFSILEFDYSGEYGYVVFDYSGKGTVSLFSSDRELPKKIVIIDYEDTVGESVAQEIYSELKPLERFGYVVDLVNDSALSDALYIVPSGAIPSNVLFNIRNNLSNSTIIYIGSKDLVFSNGLRRQSWYASLTEEQKKRLIIYGDTPEDYMATKNTSFYDLVLYETWSEKEYKNRELKGSGTETLTVKHNKKPYLKAIFDFGNYSNVSYTYLNYSDLILTPTPEKIFPWEKSTLEFELNKTNGTAILYVYESNKKIEERFLRRVTDTNVFIERLKYENPGTYILNVVDNSGRIASGVLFVKNLTISLDSRYGILYVFEVLVDGESLENAEVEVWLNNATQKEKVFVSNGKLYVRAKLPEGKHVFNFNMFDQTIKYPYENTQGSIFDFYIKWGLPGIALVVIVYFVARLSRRPTYIIRFAEGAPIKRKKIIVREKNLISIFNKFRKKMKVGIVPLSFLEVSMAIKRYITNGAEVTQGNVGELLKHLEKKGLIESFLDYYQLTGEGDVRANVLRRMIREKLIENGISFKERNGIFVTDNYEFGLYGDKFNKRAIIVFSDEEEIKSFLKSLKEEDLATLDIKIKNGMIRLIPVFKLEEVL